MADSGFHQVRCWCRVAARFTDNGTLPVEPIERTVATAPSRQFRGLKKWVQKFNVLRHGTDNSVPVVALNVLAVQKSTTQFVDVSGTVTISEQFRKVTWIPKYTILGLEIGDHIVPAQGLPESEIESVPELNRFTVEGQSQFGGRTQYVYTQGTAATTDSSSGDDE